jgi:hypothetical protein
LFSSRGTGRTELKAPRRCGLKDDPQEAWTARWTSVFRLPGILRAKPPQAGILTSSRAPIARCLPRAACLQSRRPQPRPARSLSAALVRGERSSSAPWPVRGSEKEPVLTVLVASTTAIVRAMRVRRVAPHRDPFHHGLIRSSSCPGDGPC